jgi:hypothetical protein
MRYAVVVEEYAAPDIAVDRAGNHILRAARDLSMETCAPPVPSRSHESANFLSRAKIFRLDTAQESLYALDYSAHAQSLAELFQRRRLPYMTGSTLAERFSGTTFSPEFC